jgi:hypothetical protein
MVSRIIELDALNYEILDQPGLAGATKAWLHETDRCPRILRYHKCARQTHDAMADLQINKIEIVMCLCWQEIKENFTSQASE